jgi:hypothetical protein
MIRAQKNLCFLISKQHAGSQALPGGRTVVFPQFCGRNRSCASIGGLIDMRRMQGKPE